MSPPDRPRFAIVGMACRFPGVPDLASFWDLLVDGREIRDKDRGLRHTLARSPHPEPSGEGLDLRTFDASFFQISPRECEQMDPQQRILLEVAWHAVEDAGLPLTHGGDGAVFASAFVGEQLALETGSLDGHSLHTVLGASGAGLSGRVSNHLGLTGPSVTLDSACSSSLLALHLAIGAIEAGDCAFALVGGVHVMRFADVHACYDDAGLLSPTGRCRFGADDADGICRGEGAAIVVVKRLEQALDDQDRIYAVVRGSAANHNGRRTSHISRPSAAAQADLLARAYLRAGVDPVDVDYVECHGTGTRAGDPLEVDALRVTLGGPRRTRTLRLGSVKSNVGHTEPVAGIAGVVKAALALHHRTLPPTLHAERTNRRIDWQDGALALARAASPLVDAVAGVSSFGVTGSNVHVVLASPDRPREPG
ncbi:MAG: polyketide synthase, partial [Myxococcota bacterium]